ncbi:AP-2 complex subunit sigma [Dorcoceras hygrometricum]|uniref:AP-2 complex subunit sigma n=1 Tax=Dorcoceras hygrometricum TaxID=472368 RepID=A0A2Z7BFU9_9LAMI|nr:AP-2 complex subunit sigma [Dorcoceras hygrometricum]
MCKVIHRHYVELFFSLCVDIKLAYLECIHLFVELLDHFFCNLCELDLVFNFHKVFNFIILVRNGRPSHSILKWIFNFHKLNERFLLKNRALIR